MEIVKPIIIEQSNLVTFNINTPPGIHFLKIETTSMEPKIYKVIKE
jgi:hypothetical protein